MPDAGRTFPGFPMATTFGCQVVVPPPLLLLRHNLPTRAPQSSLLQQRDLQTVACLQDHVLRLLVQHDLCVLTADLDDDVPDAQASLVRQGPRVHL